MTTKENIQKIRKACIKANPEIVQLKEGCEIEVLEDISVDSYRLIAPFKAKVIEYSVEYFGEPDETPIQYASKDRHSFSISAVEYKVIGRPIRLADVLLVIEGVDFATDSKRKDVIGNLAWGHWIFSRDDLEEQSETTIDFIAGLL